MAEKDPVMEAMEDALDLEGLSEFDPEQRQDTEEGGQEAAQEVAGADETQEEGAGTQEEGSEDQEAAEGDSEPQMISKEEFDRVKSGLTADLRRERAQRQEFEQNWQKITEALQGQYKAEQDAKSQAEVPDKDENPVEFLAHQLRQQHKELQEWKQQQEQQQVQKQQAEAYQQVVHITNADEQRFAEERQDYYEKLNAAREIRYKIISATNPDKTEQEISEMIAAGDRAFAAAALREGVSPAQKAYDASERMIRSLNYQIQKKAAEDAAEAGSNGDSTAKVPAGTAAVQKAKKAEQQRTMRSLSAASGGARGGRKITKEEFGQLMADFDPMDPGTLDPMVRQILEDEHLSRRLEVDGSITL